MANDEQARPISLADYARRIHVSRSAVSQAIAAGRLAAALVKRGRRTMIGNPQEADRLWNSGRSRTTGVVAPDPPFSAPPNRCAPAESIEVYRQGPRVVMAIIVPGNGDPGDGDQDHGVASPDSFIASARGVDMPTADDDSCLVMTKPTAARLADALRNACEKETDQ